MQHAGGGWAVGRIGPTRIVLRGGALIVVAVVAVLFGPTVQQFWPDLGAAAYVVAAGFGVLLLASVLLHEVAHAVAARRYGLDVPEIAITLVGGHTQIAGATTPGSGAVVAVVGPLTNGVIAAAAWLILPSLPAGGVPALAVIVVGSANGFVAALNLLPGLPLDGGRLLESLVWRLTGRRAIGTVIAAWSGRVLAVGCVAAAVGVPYVLGGLPDLVTVMWAALLAFILWSGSGPFLASVRRERAVARLSLAAHVRPARVVPAGSVVADLPDGPVVVVDPGPVGYVNDAAATAVPAEARGHTAVTAVMVPIPSAAVVPAGLTGAEALQVAAAAARASAVLVAVEPDGGVRGVIRFADLVAALRT